MAGGEEGLRAARLLLPAATDKAKAATLFTSRWTTIISKLALFPPRLSDLSGHPSFSKNLLCGELLRSTCKILEEILTLAENCSAVGKLRMQSDLDTVSGKMELILRDFELLMKTGVLGESTPPPSPSNLREIFTRIQIGDTEAKARAFDSLLEEMKENAAAVAAALGRSHVSALIQQLNAPSPRLREKAAAVICCLAETRTLDRTLVKLGAVSALTGLAESASLVCRESAATALAHLSVEPDTARAVVGHGGLRPLISLCRASGAATLRNISAVPELHRELVEEGAVKLAVELLTSREVEIGVKSLAAEWLRNLTSGGENVKKAAAEGAAAAVLVLLEVPSPEEPAVGLLLNLIGVVPGEALISLGLLPRLAHVLRAGSLEARATAASVVCRVCARHEAKRSAGAWGIVPPLVAMLESKALLAREAACKALLCLMSCSKKNVDLVNKESTSVPKLVRLLDPGPQNTAKKYAVLCLLLLCGSKKSRKAMVSHGAIGYLKKLSEGDAPGSKSLLHRLQSQSFGSFFMSLGPAH